MKHNEQFNTISHLVGAVLALPAIIVLIVFASLKGDPWRIVSFSIYGLSLFSLYLFSTLYHGARGRIRRFLQRLDHIAIYLLIAGSYTPFTLITLRGGWGWSLFGVVWGLAIIGIVLDSLHRKGPRNIQMAIYVSMGWIIVIAIYPLVQNLSGEGLFWLVAGGLFYTFGIIFYVLDNRMRHAHGIWHLFVLAGSASHYFTMLFYLL
ncbi:MAG: hemolysin III family protein [Gammaproteobacteria bacterium]|nr:hemolysin III family protein [Gammaproteobacteria bacterium]